MKYKKIDLNDLPKYNPWPERLLGLSPWSIQARTIEKTEQEYNCDKYLACLNKLEEAKGNITMSEMKCFEQAKDSTEVCISIDDELFLTTLGEARKAYYGEIKQTLQSSILKSSTVIELGSGYGYNLWMLSQEFPNSNTTWVGGEYADNAIFIGKNLTASNITFEKFNFYQTPYNILEKATGPITVFSVYAAQQLPSAKEILLGLRPYKDKIERVVFFESVYEYCDSKNLLGLMRKRYIEICDYNTDMLTILESAEDIEIISERKNVIGLNPLLPVSIIEWKFR